MVERMEKRYLSLGGTIKRAAPVAKVIVENDVAKGVVLKNGEVMYSDWVVSTTPVEHCLVDLLDNKYHDKKFDIRLADEKTYPIYTYTLAAVKCSAAIAEKALSLNVSLDKPVCMDREYNSLSIRNYGYDTTVKMKDGCCILQVTIHSNDDMYYWWKKVKDEGKYKEEKQRIAEEFLAIAKAIHPDVADSMEIIDVVTPCTYERYLNSRHGCFQGFVHTSKGKSLMQNGRLKGLKNFLLAGQWLIQSGGLPTAVMSGRFTAQRICHDDKKKFVPPQL
jgi:phytoene dehydrogenase-like protein